MHDTVLGSGLVLSKRHQIIVFAALVALLIASRGHHFPTVAHMLPTASWATFFLAGVYLGPAWALGVLLCTAVAVDYAAVTWGGVNGFCISPAYIALIPAYGALWFAGRWYAARYRFTSSTLLSLAVAMVVGAAVCELISSGGFYFYSGRLAQPTLAGFGQALATYFPRSLYSLAFWIATSAILHSVLVTVRWGDARR